MEYADLDFSHDEYEQLILHHPEVILNNEHLFRWGLEHLFYIEDKHENIRLLKLKEAQRRFLHTYFTLKAQAGEGEIGARIIILKSRQQGMTTLIDAIATFESILRGNRDSLIVAHEKGDVAKKIFAIYKRYLAHFPFPEWDMFKKRSESGEGYELHNNSVIDVSYEKPRGIVGVTVQMLHLSEASRFRTLDTFLGSFMPAMPKFKWSSAILESTAEKSGDAFHTMYQQAERGNSAWYPVFYPWYIDEDNILEFSSEQAKVDFKESLESRPDSEWGDEVSLLNDYEDITLEHLHQRRNLIKEAPHGLASFKREFPTTPEEAFMGVNQPVFDIKVLRQYEKEQIREPEMYGQMFIDIMDMPNQQTRFEEAPHGILKIYKRPDPKLVYMIGSDHSEGMNDFNAALIASQHPFEVVAEMVGYDGYNPIPRVFARQMYHAGKWYNDAWICPESNPPGNTVVDLLLEWQYPNLISEAMIFPEKTSSINYGWRNTTDTRKKALEKLRETVKTMAIGIPNIKFLRQLEYFCTVSVDGGTRVKDQALKKGQHRAIGANVDEYMDDLVFAALGLEHARHALGNPEVRRRGHVDEMRDVHGQTWVSETVSSVEALFGELPENDMRTTDGNQWRDYA